MIMTTTSAEPARNDSRRILDLLSQGRITVEEADQLLRALARSPARASGAPGEEPRRDPPRWIRITVDKPAREGRPPKQVTIRVPMAVVRGGARLGAMFPRVAGERVTQKLREQGIDIGAIDFAQVETVLGDLGETTIDVDDGRGKAQVRISTEA
jgi:hypothetical protein